MQSRSLLQLSLLLLLLSGCSTQKEATPSSAKSRATSQANYLEARSLLDSWQGELSFLSAAKEKLDLVVADDPDFLPARVELARYRIMLYASFRDPEQLNVALQLLQSCAQKDRTYAKPYVLMGHLYVLRRQFGESQQALERAEAIGTDDPWLNLNFADLYEQSGQPRQATTRALAALQSDALYPKTIAAAITTVFKNGDAVAQQEAVNSLAQYLNSRDLSREVLVELADRLVRGWGGRRNQLVAAAIVVDKLGSDYPEYSGTYVAAAKLVLQTGYKRQSGAYSIYDRKALKAADELLDKALQMDPGNVDVRLEIANLHFNSKKIDAAADILTDPAVAAMEDSRIYALRGRIYQAQYKNIEAIAAYENAVRVATHTKAVAEAETALTIIYPRVGRLDDAEAIHLRAIAMAPNNAWAYGNYAAFLLHSRKDPEQAIAYAEKALAIMNYGLARQTLAEALQVQAAQARRREGATGLNQEAISRSYLQ